VKLNKRMFLIIGTVAVSTLIVVAAIGAKSQRQEASAATPTATIVIKDQGGFTTAISTVAEQLQPAVVHIDITGTVDQQVPQFGNPFGDDPFFKYFFGPPQQGERKVPIRALGSGVIISPEGYIITNNHVVSNADKIEVELNDGTKQDAKLIGTDPNTDLAVVKIDPTSGMKYARLGDSDKVKVGEWVVAIGSPRGFDWTVTAGIVSAKHRTGIGALGPAGYEDFIQTDASINPGNSGGPLINLNGEVIGINSLIISASQGSEGMGFAIPSNMVKDISQSLIAHGKVVRGYMGVSIQNVTPDMAKNLKLKDVTTGVIVSDVVADGPAEKAGMEQGDVIVSFDGKKIEDTTQLRNLVAQTDPGSSVNVTVVRNNKEVELSLKVGDLAKAQTMVAKAEVGNDLLGVSVEKVTPQVAKNMGLKKTDGVIITNVAPGSAADKAGLSRNDIIYRVGNTVVNDPAEFSSLVSRNEQSGTVLLLVRSAQSGNTGYLVVKLQ
jgi:serine protease Do